MDKNTSQRVWYKKKRYIIPLAVFVLLVVVASFGKPSQPANPIAAPVQNQLQGTTQDLKTTEPQTQTTPTPTTAITPSTQLVSPHNYPTPLYSYPTPYTYPTPSYNYPTPSYNYPTPAATGACCKICTTGRACGDSCISASYTCHKPTGCACNG